MQTHTCPYKHIHVHTHTYIDTYTTELCVCIDERCLTSIFPDNLKKTQKVLYNSYPFSNYFTGKLNFINANVQHSTTLHEYTTHTQYTRTPRHLCEPSLSTKRPKIYIQCFVLKGKKMFIFHLTNFFIFL